jgi:hypothetical protein
MSAFWDLGRNDLNTIWLHQHVDGFDRFVGYYENSGEFIGHYVAWLKGLVTFRALSGAPEHHNRSEWLRSRIPATASRAT